MNPSVSIDRFSAIYPTAHIRGQFITRLEEQSLGSAVLDATMAEELGREQIGWFVGRHPGVFARAAEQLARLDINSQGGIWIAVPFSRDLSLQLFANWPYRDHVPKRPSSENSAWRSRKVWFAVPADLKHLLPFAKKVEPGVAGLIVLDPPCITYKARCQTDSWGHRHRNDRPQHVVNFRAEFDFEGWQPPLLLLTDRPAKAVNTQVVARALCLNAFRFISGDSFACWELPISED